MATKKTHGLLTTQARIGIHEYHVPLSELPNSCFYGGMVELLFWDELLF